MNDIEKFINYILVSKQLDLLPDYILYKKNFKVITKEELFQNIAYIYNVNYYDFIKPLKPRERKSNLIVHVKGNLVKWILDNGIKGFTVSNIYRKLYDQQRHHSVAIHHRKKEFWGKELETYTELCKFLDEHEVIWE